MTTRSRILLALASLLLLLAYVLPLWRISLEAPQYPGGLGMQIHIDNITGLNPHDLQNINGLNHYIGMQEIVPDSIPELDFMPWIFAALIGFGLLAAALGKRSLLYAWTGSFALLLVVGFADYYKWGHDYGHNLSPDAAIKIPGMGYQPPLIGSKAMLNFMSHSWPDTGGIVVFGAFLVGVVLVVMEFRRRGRDKKAVLAEAVSTQKSASGIAVAAALLVVFAAGCQPTPQPLVVGETGCAHCRMTVTDARFGAELVSTTSKVYPFDAIECLTAYLIDNPGAEESAHSFWVSAFDEPGTLVAAEDAFFIQSDRIQSPMGAGLAAYSTVDARESARTEVGGDALDWRGVLASAELAGTDVHAAHAH